MKREEFLNTFGIGIAAICTGSCLASCKKSSGPGQTPGPTPPIPPANVNFTIDLNNEIKAVGESKTGNGIIVVRTATGNDVTSFTAVQAACTHEGSIIGYNATQGQFVCPNHGSTFSAQGNVTLGPAISPLKKYTVAITGSTMTVTG